MIIGSIPGAKTNDKKKKVDLKVEKQTDEREEQKGHCLFIGNLDKKVTDAQLHQAFASTNNYPSLLSATVVMDRRTGVSKGYGFLRLGDAEEVRRALREMQAKYVGAKPIKIVRSKQHHQKDQMKNKNDNDD